LFLRVYEKIVVAGDELLSGKNNTHYKHAVKEDEEPDFFDIPVKIKDESWYINLPENNKNYYCELIFGINNDETLLCRSNTITSPAKTFKDIHVSGNFIDEDILLLSGIYRFDEDDNNGNPIPQRIISFLDNKYLSESSGN
jgi:hypothetical protein